MVNKKKNTLLIYIKTIPRMLTEIRYRNYSKITLWQPQHNYFEHGLIWSKGYIYGNK